MSVGYAALDKKLNDQEYFIRDLIGCRDMIRHHEANTQGPYHPAIILLDKEIVKQTTKLARWKEKEGVR